MATSGESGQLLTRYLLNEVSEEERECIEEQLFINRDFLEQLETAEMRLIDRYVLGEMSADEGARFESQYLPVPEHARRVREAKQFHAQLKKIGPAYDDEGDNGPPPFSWAARFGVPALVGLSLLAIGAFVGARALRLAQQGSDGVINASANQTLMMRAEPPPPPVAQHSPPPVLKTERRVDGLSNLRYSPQPASQSPPRVAYRDWFTYRTDTLAKVSNVTKLNSRRSSKRRLQRRPASPGVATQ